MPSIPKEHAIAVLTQLGACPESILALQRSETVQQAYENCNFEWLCWLYDSLQLWPFTKDNAPLMWRYKNALDHLERSGNNEQHYWFVLYQTGDILHSEYAAKAARCHDVYVWRMGTLYLAVSKAYCRTPERYQLPFNFVWEAARGCALPPESDKS
jgi:hypothetical protein